MNSEREPKLRELLNKKSELLEKALDNLHKALSQTTVDLYMNLFYNYIDDDDDDDDEEGLEILENILLEKIMQENLK